MGTLLPSFQDRLISRLKDQGLLPMTTGITKALPQFEAAGLDVTLVDTYCLPFDTDELLKLAEGGPILSVEDNYIGGVASEIAEAIARAGHGRADALVIRNIPKSGKTPEDLLAYCHMSETDILAKAKEMVG